MSVHSIKFGLLIPPVAMQQYLQILQFMIPKIVELQETKKLNIYNFSLYMLQITDVAVTPCKDAKTAPHKCMNQARHTRHGGKASPHGRLTGNAIGNDGRRGAMTGSTCEETREDSWIHRDFETK